MKKQIIIIFCLFGMLINAQSVAYNTKKNFVAEGYDVTEYFNNKAIKGNSKFVATYDQVNYKFISQENLNTFKKNPEKYVPQYGGYCAYAISVNNEKVAINPKTFEIRDQKLYLFYNSWGVNTLEKWKNENPEKLKNQADKNWGKLKMK
ncbi:hypothetical protein J8281_04410 [Aquimarina sp. U1-2]|uniref:YHS domain-containing (seleno)protein n=1 Tax=Aquimarina sp. U1-2 TaxID=2823141 RepID=UPI001AECD23D|nr:YHS domain-containing (seleno)protein [Aquimarina sp. U1-2]MBP2831423.1 hypothetical protein [Aquimarina sp. U1-2]